MLTIVFGKVHKYVRLSESFSLVECVTVLAADILLFAGLIWGFSTLLRRLSGGAKWAAAIALHILGLVLLVIAFVEHAAFAKTGTVVDLYMVGYTLEQFAMLANVLGSETPDGLWIAGALMLLYLVAPLIWGRRKPFRGPKPTSQPTVDAGGLTWSRPLISTVTVLVTLVLMGFWAPIEGTVYELRANAIYRLGHQAATMPSDEIDDAAIAAVTLADPVRLMPTAQRKRYNVVYIVMESARARSTSVYNDQLENTPRLKELAEVGLVAEQAHTVISHTSKALVPIFCGIYPEVDTPISEALADAIPTTCLPRLMRSRGYATAFFQPAQEGFEQRAGMVSNFGFEHFAGKESLARAGFHESNYFGFEDDIMLDPVLEWVGAQGDKPFMLGVLTLTSHHDYVVPNGFPTKHYVDDEQVNNYLNTLAYTDRFIGKLVDGLKARGKWENTIIAIVGDHGEGFNEHGREQHDNVIWQEGQRVPMVFTGGALAQRGLAGKRVPGTRQIIDVLPTTLDLLGYRHTGGDLPGKSLKQPGHAESFHSCWYKNNCMALRRGDMKIIYHYRKRPVQVFDLAQDPLEQNDLAKTTDIDTKAAVDAMLAWKRKVNLMYAAHGKRRTDIYVTMQKPAEIPNTLEARFGDAIEILGYEQSAKTVKPGSSVELAYYLHARAKPPAGWRFFLHIIGPRNTFLNADHGPVGGAHPLTKWAPGQYIEDRHSVSIGAQSPPGEYKVYMGVWKKGQPRMPITGDGLTVSDGRLQVTTFIVTK